MKTRAHDLLDAAALLLGVVGRCPIASTCVICEDHRREARDLARAALLSTLRKRRLELTYFVDAERIALDAQLRARLTNRT